MRRLAVLCSRHAPGDFRVMQVEAEGIVTLACTGELDMATCAQLTEAVQRAVSSTPTVVRIDCAQVGFVDSTGIRSLLEARRHADGHGIEFQVVPSREVQRLLDLVGVSLAG
ncbi:MAG: anti-sigma factor antagonist [Gaiellales bacterium]|jgi:anti-anti-sigma factor|nr:anti-sigma factor antagonist [Gaiellales bacterium]